jgi:hypothetical protein
LLLKVDDYSGAQRKLLACIELWQFFMPIIQASSATRYRMRRSGRALFSRCGTIVCARCSGVSSPSASGVRDSKSQQWHRLKHKSRRPFRYMALRGSGTRFAWDGMPFRPTESSTRSRSASQDHAKSFRRSPHWLFELIRSTACSSELRGVR